MSHCLLLYQRTPESSSRCYLEYESLDECLEALCRMYETELSKEMSEGEEMTFDIERLYSFIDEMADMVCFVFVTKLEAYRTHTRRWIKEKMFHMLVRQSRTT